MDSQQVHNRARARRGNSRGEPDDLPLRRVRRLNPPCVRLGLAAGIVAGILVACGGQGADEQTRAEYIASVAVICETYGQQLDEIPPPTDPSSPGAVFESIDRALPILREQAETLRALKTPNSLRDQVARFFVLTDESILKLEQARHQAEERELFLMVQAIAAFETVRDEAKELARSIGFNC